MVQHPTVMANTETTPTRLQSCPESPNCVSSESTDPTNHINPINYDGSDNDVMKRLIDVVRDMPRSTIVESKPKYFRAEFRSTFFRFVDDVEFLINETSGVIHVRSASRVGYWDLGVNRRRVEYIRAQLEKSSQESH